MKRGKRVEKRRRSGIKETQKRQESTKKSRLGRVKFAGCLFPLTHSLSLDRPSLVPSPSSRASPSLPSPFVPHYSPFLFFYYFTSHCVSESGAVLPSLRREPAVVAPFEMQARARLNGKKYSLTRAGVQRFSMRAFPSIPHAFKRRDEMCHICVFYNRIR